MPIRENSENLKRFETIEVLSQRSFDFVNTHKTVFYDFHEK